MPHASATNIYYYTRSVLCRLLEIQTSGSQKRIKIRENTTIHIFICCFKTTIFILVKRYVSLCSFFLQKSFHLFTVLNMKSLSFTFSSTFFICWKNHESWPTILYYFLIEQQQISCSPHTNLEFLQRIFVYLLWASLVYIGKIKVLN